MNHIKDTLKKYIFLEGVVGCFAALCADIAIVNNINVSECVIKWVYIANAVISILFNIVLNFCYPRSNKRTLNVYLMFVAPEGQDIEKFIQKEIKELEQVNAGYKINFVLPCKIQRLSFDNYAQYLLITSLSEQEMKRNVRMLLNKKAFKGVNKDLTYYADMAYMLLLMDNYKEADRVYKKVFNTQNNQIEVNSLCNGLLDYCDIASTKAYEKCYASYLKFRIYIYNGKIQEAKFIMDSLSSENVVNTNILNRMKEIMNAVCPLDVSLS